MTDDNSFSPPDTTTKDRPFNYYRLPKSDKAKALVTDVLNQLQNYESNFKLRARKRRSDDQKLLNMMVTALVCDLVHVHLTAPEKALYVSLSKRTDNKIKRYSPSSFGRTLPDVLSKLSSSELCFVDMNKGQQGYFGNARQTTIKPAKRLLSRILELGVELSDLTEDINRETIILKKSKENYWDNGKWLDYEDTATISQHRVQMMSINQWLAQADIECDPLDNGLVVDVSNRFLKRVFNNGSFESGGRLFGGFWQSLKKDERKSRIRINDYWITTLDYSQAAPKIAYALVGAIPPDGDAYSIPGYEFNRKAVKKVMNAMLYASKPLSRFPSGTRGDFEKSLRFNQVREKVINHHQPIAHLFGTGIGLKVMYLESQILVKALLDCIDHNIVALPVHDALVIAEDDKVKTAEIMLRAFRDITKVEGHIGEE